jgi:selenocysteine lyase/cysteine desulfurase
MGTENIGAVRVSVASFNKEAEIDKFMWVLTSKILKK